jgi:integrase
MASRFVKLTQASIKALAPGKVIEEHGIKVERTKAGDLRYVIAAMVDGKRISRAMGMASAGMTRQQCEAALEVLRTRAREERLDLPKGRKLHRSFSDSAADYLSRMDETGGRDMANKRRHINAYLIPYLGAERLNQITEYKLRQYRKHREDQGAKPATVNRELATFSHLMRRAASKGWAWIRPEDLPVIPKEREARKQIHILRADQCERLIAAAKADQDQHAYLFVLFGLNTSMRHSEILYRKFADVDFASNRMWINRAKAGERSQPITLTLKVALEREMRQREDKDGWIFPATRSDSKSGHRRELGIAFKRCVEAAGLNPSQCTPHVMRHTAITRLVMANVDLLTIKKVTGHKTTAMVEHYTHIHGSHVDEAIRAIETTL